jgi:hypothetical protein
MIWLFWCERASQRWLMKIKAVFRRRNNIKLHALAQSRRHVMKLNVVAFALAFGIWWGGGVFIATWWLIAQDGATTAPMSLDQFYYGYGLTPMVTA